ncbi:MAG: NAD(P)-dependent alcohol dehydrogenase [Flavobacteriales bacterium]|nr:NAD(P)-dependent alcohol dehydrogenase [Flavobacteriales bacterium]
MKASYYTNYGGIEQLSIRDIPEPTPTATQIKIRVHCATVNRTDCGFLTGKPFIARFFSGLRRPRFQVLGNEFAGEVVAIGNDVKRFKLGDRVFGYEGTHFGAHAEYMVMDENGGVGKIPDNIAFDQAAAACEGGHYALIDIQKAKVDKGSVVLVNGATGAIGSAAVQIMKHLGAEVVAVCGTDHLSTLKTLGADEVIDYRTSDFTQIDKQFDFIFDAVGKSTFAKCKRILKPKGIYVSTELGPYNQNPFLALVSKFSTGKKLLFPIPIINTGHVDFIANMLAIGTFKPLIDRTYQLEQTNEAFTYVLTGEKIGNVLLKIR